MYRLRPDPRVPADFDIDSLFDGDRQAVNAAIADWGLTPRCYFLIERVDAPFYTVAAVAAAIRVDTSAVNRWILDGELKADLIGKRYRIRPADLDAFVQAGRGGRKKGIS